MFKIICDVIIYPLNEIKNAGIFPKKATFVPASIKYNAVIGYSNCQTCNVGDFKITTTSRQTSPLDEATIKGVWNGNLLNPTNNQYSQAYRNILNKDRPEECQPETLKFIGLFQNDPGITQGYLPNSLTNLFETIIDTSKEGNPYAYSDYYQTGFWQYHQKSSFFQVTNSTRMTHVTPASLSSTDAKTYYINRDLAAYMLRGQGAVSCATKIQYQLDDYYYSHGEFNDYINWLEHNLIETLKNNLSKFRHCELEDGSSILIVNPDAASANGITKDICEASKGSLTPMLKVIQEICDQVSPSYQLVNQDYAPITCGNYEKMIDFDAAGEIEHTMLPEIMREAYSWIE